MNRWRTEDLGHLLTSAARQGEHAGIDDKQYLAAFGLRSSGIEAQGAVGAFDRNGIRRAARSRRTRAGCSSTICAMGRSRRGSAKRSASADAGQAHEGLRRALAKHWRTVGRSRRRRLLASCEHGAKGKAMTRWIMVSSVCLAYAGGLRRVGKCRPRAGPSRRGSRSIRCGRSRCRTTGSSARRSASPSTRATTSGSSIGSQSLNARNGGERRARTRRPATCCMPAPPVLEFDRRRQPRRPRGAARAQGYDWPTSNHGITVDHKGNVWIGGNGAKDAHILKFTQRRVSSCCRSASRAGNDGSNDPRTSGASPRSRSTPKANEAYVADGYGNKRVVVLDADTGEMQALLGRLRQQARRHRPRRRTIPTRRRRSSSATPCTAPSRRATASSTSATASTTASRCSARTARS